MHSHFKALLNKAKRLLEFLFYYPFDSLVLSTCQYRPDQKLSAIVHVELIGDYILWLPYGQLLAHHFRTNGQQVAVVVNEQVLRLAEKHFPHCKIIGVNRTAILRNLRYRTRMLRILATIHPIHTYHDSSPREARIGDAIVRALGAPALGFAATYPDQATVDTRLHRHLYYRLVPETKGIHQNLRHLAFAKAIGAPVEFLKAAESLNDIPPPAKVPYFVVVPGASRPFRRWPVKHFLTIAERILELRPDWHVVVLGTTAEAELGECIESAVGSQRVRNLTGRTNLAELVHWIDHAELLIGNDSGAGHIAAAYGTPSLIIVGGGHYGRCFPYDPSEAHVRELPSTVTYQMDCFGCDWRCRYPVVPDEPVPCIAGISVDAAWEATQKVLAGNGKTSHTTPDFRSDRALSNNGSSPLNRRHPSRKACKGIKLL